MGLYKNFVSQTRKPEGFLGQMMVNGMNNGHAKMADWGMSHLQTIAPETILEVGCGGGRNAHALMEKYPSSKLTAVDYSVEEIEGALRVAGFSKVKTDHHESKPWITVIAKK